MQTITRDTPQKHHETQPRPGQKLKIAYIMSRFPKLTETFILYEILALEKMGVRVEIFPLLRERQTVMHPEAAAMVARAHFHPFISLPILQAQWYFIRRNPSAYFGVITEILHGTLGSLNFFFGALGIFAKTVRIAYEMKHLGVTHVHAHFATHPALAGLIIKRLTGIPFSFTAHGSDLHVERRMLDKKVEAAAFAVTVSEYNKEIILRECRRNARRKVFVVHCGVDPEEFTPTSQKKDRTQPFQILCVASFEEVKGHQYLLEACKALEERGVDFECHLVGYGPRKEEVERQIAQLKLQGRIIIHGGLPRREVIRMLAEADVKALASVPTRGGKREGIPVVLMEAMACGLPVVSSKLSGIPEVVADGRSGFLVNPRDVRGIADSLYKLYRSPELRHAMGQAGREIVLKEFDLRRNAKSLTDLFLNFASQRQ